MIKEWPALSLSSNHALLVAITNDGMEEASFAAALLQELSPASIPQLSSKLQVFSSREHVQIDPRCFATPNTDSSSPSQPQYSLATPHNCFFIVYILFVLHAKSLQLHLTLCNPMDHTPPGSSIHGVLQARVQEWVAMPSVYRTSPKLVGELPEDKHSGYFFFFFFLNFTKLY